jgi:thiamine kinase-like enzyme
MLSDLWPYMKDDKSKKRICEMTWELVKTLRQVPKPEPFAAWYQCCADGTASNDILLAQLDRTNARPLRDDEELRHRIHDRYRAACAHQPGSEPGELARTMFPASDSAVFTHADICPRNIVISDDEENPVSGLLGWESAGWYPKYWEYANMMRPWNNQDWRDWMARTAPAEEKWDISALDTALTAMLRFEDGRWKSNSLATRCPEYDSRF